MTSRLFTKEDVHALRAVLIDARLMYARATGLLARKGPECCDLLDSLADRIASTLEPVKREIPTPSKSQPQTADRFLRHMESLRLRARAGHISKCTASECGVTEFCGVCEPPDLPDFITPS